MGVNNYPPEIAKQIENVCKDPAIQIFQEFGDIPLGIKQITQFLKGICSFLKQNHAAIGTIDYLLELNFLDETNDNTMSPQAILNAFKNDRKTIVVNRNLNLIALERFNDFSNSGIASFCKQHGSVCVFIQNGIDITIYIKGFPAKEINVNYPLSSPRLNKRFARPARDYKLSVIDFYKHRVIHNLTKHWQDPRKRILKGGKTEDIFQDGLFNWLDENIGDALVLPKVKKISSDETDIEVRAFGGNSYLIEIKWLGVNESNTPYDESRIKKSITQVKNYLKTDQAILEASIVVYDGREYQKFEKLNCVDYQEGEWKEIRECQSSKLPEKGTCFVFFLISEPASIRKN